MIAGMYRYFEHSGQYSDAFFEVVALEVKIVNRIGGNHLRLFPNLFHIQCLVFLNWKNECLFRYFVSALNLTIVFVFESESHR